VRSVTIVGLAFVSENQIICFFSFVIAVLSVIMAFINPNEKAKLDQEQLIVIIVMVI
jgi:NADH:ubiquinone oxidoreductase subunit K